MAIVDRDETGDPFVNVTHQVGASGDWDDLLVVQALLDLVYTYNDKLRKSSPIKGRVTVTGKPAPDTVPLIRHFQQTVVKQNPPKGYINHANAPRKKYSTIWHLGLRAEQILIAGGQFSNPIQYLKAAYPLLAPILSASKDSSGGRDHISPQRERARDW